jgi:putative DNA-invertase from lambdoid prophage Rac
MKAAKRAALYHRVSTVDQNPALARRELRDAAKRYGMHIALDVEETGSGANNNRPGLVRVLEAARRGRIDAVLVWKLDRFGRSALDLLTNLRALESAGTRFVCVTQGIDIHAGGEAMSRLLLTLLSAVAEFERDLIIERTKLGIARARESGVRIGRPRVPRPSQREVRSLRSQGFTWSDVADQLECTVWAARDAAKKGGAKRLPQVPKKKLDQTRSQVLRKGTTFRKSTPRKK